MRKLHKSKFKVDSLFKSRPNNKERSKKKQNRGEMSVIQKVKGKTVKELAMGRLVIVIWKLLRMVQFVVNLLGNRMYKTWIMLKILIIGYHMAKSISCLSRNWAAAVLETSISSEIKILGSYMQ